MLADTLEPEVVALAVFQVPSSVRSNKAACKSDTMDLICPWTEILASMNSALASKVLIGRRSSANIFVTMLSTSRPLPIPTEEIAILNSLKT